MFNTIAYFEAIDRAATDSDVNALTGTAESVLNNHHQLFEDMFLLAAYFGTTSAARAKLRSPKLREYGGDWQIRPVDRALVPSDVPALQVLRDNPLRLRRGEDIQLLITADGVTGTNENMTGVLFVGDANYNLPRGERIINIRATGATTVTANAWSNVPLTFDEVLPAGVWEVIGMEAISANGIAARLVIPGQWNRPGCLCMQAVNSWPSNIFANGQLGSYGRFSTQSLPSVEWLANGADTAQTVFLKAVKVG